jgi:carbonic anhydrase
MHGTILASESSPTVVSSSNWNYDTLGPDFWKVGFSTSCGNGQSQSPINIISAATAYDGTLARIQFYNYNKVFTWNITNNGHTSIDNIYTINYKKFKKLL